MTKVGVTLIFILMAAACSVEKHSELPPNIVWITSEDNSKHYLKIFDKGGAETPNIEHLAEEGVIFTRAFSNTPVCSSARSALISGCYGPRIAAHYHRKVQMVPMPEGVEMFPVYLRKAGYHTTNNAKEDYNIIKSDEVWDESSKQASWRQRGPGQPFFHVFNIHTTHESSLHFTEDEMESEGGVTLADSNLVQPNHPPSEIFRFTNSYYRHQIELMDQQVGQVVQELREEGLLEDTFIFYFGDHGGVLPGSKGYLSETGLHVPLVVYIPPKYRHLVTEAPGSRSNRFVSFVDFGATVLSLAGVKLPAGIDGQPFIGADIMASNKVYSYADRFDEKYDMVRALRKENFKYVRNFQPFNYDGLMNNYRYKQLAFQEWRNLYLQEALDSVQAAFFRPKPPEALYDLEVDPFETNDLSQDPGYASVLQDLRQDLNGWIEGMPDLSFYPEHYLIKSAFKDPVAFGQKHKLQIKAYLEIANLQLGEFDKAAGKISEALESTDPWERYWGLISCSSFGKAAQRFSTIAREIAQNDPEMVNRVRAAEFLGLIGEAHPAQVMNEALYQTNDITEALLILNSIVLMQDGMFRYPFDMDLRKIPMHIKEDDQIKRRLMYLGLI